MFGKNVWTDKLKDALTSYVDERFEEYRERLANDLSRGLAELAIILLVWTISILILIFGALFLSLIIAQLLQPFLGGWSYAAGFGIIFLLISGMSMLFFRMRVKWVEEPVFRLMIKALLNPKSEESTPENITASNAEVLEHPSITDSSQEDWEVGTEEQQEQEFVKQKDPFRD